MYDIVFKGGTIIDGTGQPGFTGDLAVTAGRINAVGGKLGEGRRTIDANGLLVAPAWVDVHTHYDGQVTWDPQLAPSLWHGVGTVVFGNCGVGFAPVKPDRHRWLIQLMEGVEDIPGVALEKGIPWGWESFAEYLDVLAAMPRTIDVGAQLTHGALRAFVMGERGAKNQPATGDEIASMAAMVTQAIHAGALGFSTSRTLIHTAIDGEPVPGTFAPEEELSAMARAIVSAGRGILEWVPRGVGGEEANAGALIEEMRLMRRITATGCPVTFLIVQNNTEPNQWREQMRIVEAAAQAGERLTPQVFARPICTLFSIAGDHPFTFLPSYAALKDLPLDERLRSMRSPEVKRRLLADVDPNKTGMSLIYQNPLIWQRTYPMGTPLSYTPAEKDSIANIAKRQERDPREVAYDLLLENDGRAFLMYAAANYAEGNPDALHEMLSHPLAVLGGSDAGAHVRVICDASIPTYMMTKWSREHRAGDAHHLPIERVIKKMTSETARLYGMFDRGTLEPGMKANLNLIDYDNLAIEHPEMVKDLPGGMPRLMQKARGYVATFVNGEMIQENGRETGARPGKVVRGIETRAL
ncbi:MAG TPA: amidohydrolase family protein [Candidatus Binataceae bacterium]|nr:amidohydrolase family protein [Candidatus Binataceae bacterium]